MEGIVMLVIFAACGAFASYGMYLKYKNEQEAALTETIAKEKAKENLTGKKAVVILRKKDGGPIMLETLLIKSLMAYGANVVNIPRETADQIAGGKHELIPDGLIGFIGSAWATDEIYHIDVRAITHAGEFMASAYAHSRSPEAVAQWIAREIGSTLKVSANIQIAKT
jgi:hypothetical protein